MARDEAVAIGKPPHLFQCSESPGLPAALKIRLESGGYAHLMDGHAFLRETADLIRSGWCHDAEARNRYGQAVAPSDPTATAWSLRGALIVVADRPGRDRRSLRDALWGISGVITEATLDTWNDQAGRTQDDAIEMLGHARDSLRAHPPPDSGWSLPIG